MAYDLYLAERIEKILVAKKNQFDAKKMFGGLCYMIKNKMCVGIVHNQLMARINPEIYEISLTKLGCKEMTFSGKPMKGMVYVDPEGYDMDEDLEYWIQLCLDFNPFAKESKKRKK